MPVEQPAQTSSAVFTAFNVLAAEAQMTQNAKLHQTAGWKDLDDVQIWKEYVTESARACSCDSEKRKQLLLCIE